MISAPSLTGAGLLLGLSLFLGLAFEDFFAHSNTRRPGGIRTFPLLAAAGGVLYLFDPTHFLPFTAGLIVLGIWLAIFYRQHVGEHDEEGEPNVGLVVPVLNAHAYILGAVALALPPWVAVAFTVTAVLLLTGREQLHALARRLELKEIVTAGEFMILTGIILPLLPNKPVTDLTTITPRQAWLALIVVCTLSYASYLAQRYWAAAARGLWMAALGGLYSSTATTVVLARQAKSDRRDARQAQAGITLATAIMYLRILAIVAFFNITLAWELAPALCGLSLAGIVICALQFRRGKPSVASNSPASALQRTGGKSAGARSRRDLCIPVHRGVVRIKLGESAVRNVRHLCARGHRRRHRYRSFRAQSGAGRHGGNVEQCARGGYPHRRVVQQYS